MIEAHVGNMGFMYAVYVEEEFIEEFPTPAKARAEAREQARLCEGMSVCVVKYREIYRVKEKKVGENQ